jgi:hypothetical protein
MSDCKQTFNFHYKGRNTSDINIFLEDNKGVDIDTATVESWIKEGVKYFKENGSEPIWYSLSGNKLVFMTNYEDDTCDIYVAKLEKTGYVEGI